MSAGTLEELYELLAQGGLSTDTNRRLDGIRDQLGQLTDAVMVLASIAASDVAGSYPREALLDLEAWNRRRKAAR